MELNKYLKDVGLTEDSFLFKKEDDSRYLPGPNGMVQAETWSLDYTLACLIYPRLCEFKKLNIGYPGSLTPEKWDEILDKMIEAFKLILQSDNRHSLTNAESRRINKKISYGLRLFAKYYRDLWW